MAATESRRLDPAAGWVFLPAAGALIFHAPVLRFDLLARLHRPIDGGAELRGRRVLGDNKTWRGAAVMFTGGLATTLALARVKWFRDRLPAELAAAPAPVYGALLGLSVVAGELPTSFVKRQLGVRPGARAPMPLAPLMSLYDQGDFVVVGTLIMRPVWRPSRAELAGAFAAVSAVHLAFNVVGYAIGARDTPI